jgi:hypothetical protein
MICPIVRSIPHTLYEVRVNFFLFIAAVARYCRLVLEYSR